MRWLTRLQGYLLCTCCLKTLSCSMIVLRTDSLLSCLKYSSIGSSKEYNGFCPLTFSNNLAIFLIESLLSVSLAVIPLSPIRQGGFYEYQADQQPFLKTPVWNVSNFSGSHLTGLEELSRNLKL